MTLSPDAKKWASICERLAKAFVVAFVAVYVMSGLNVGSFSDISLLQKAADAGLAALGSLILSLFGTNIGNTATPSLLPKRLDPTTRTPLITVEAQQVAPLEDVQAALDETRAEVAADPKA